MDIVQKGMLHLRQQQPSLRLNSSLIHHLINLISLVNYLSLWAAW